MQASKPTSFRIPAALLLNAAVTAALAIFVPGCFAEDTTVPRGTGGSPGISKLSGGLERGATVSPSLLVTPDSIPVSQRVQQFAAGQTYHPGQSAPIPPKPKPKPPAPAPAAAPAAPAAPVAALPPVKPPPKPPTPPPPPYTLSPKNGIMTWVPGIKAEVVAPPKPPKQAEQKKLESVKDLYGSLLSKPSPVVPAVARPEQLALPKVQKGMDSSSHITWTQWYSRVSKVIYDQWSTSDVCPGTAVVHVTAWRTHTVDCQIRDFLPADDVKRNVYNETRFRQLALQACQSLQHCPVLEFPWNAPEDKIGFDMEFKREVGGPVGCHIAPL